MSTTPDTIRGTSLLACAVAVCGLLFVQPPLTAQVHSLALGAYGGLPGTGIEATAMLHRRIGVLVRYEGLFFSAEHARWLGGRVDLTGSDMKVYVTPLIGMHYCFLNELGGTASGCAAQSRWRLGGAILIGVELEMGASSHWSIGGEFGYRFVEAGERTRWARGVTVRYRLYQRQ